MRSNGQSRCATTACSEQTYQHVPARTPHNGVLRIKAVMRISALPVQPPTLPPRHTAVPEALFHRGSDTADHLQAVGGRLTTMPWVYRSEMDSHNGSFGESGRA